MDYIEIILSIAGGLALFIFSISSLSDTVQQLAGERTQTWITRFTRSNWLAVLTGVVVTAIVGSSSVV